jgi:hypothetical protein
MYNFGRKSNVWHLGWYELQQKCQNIFLINVWRKIVFDICFTGFGTALTTILPILFLYCYKYVNNRKTETRNDPDLVQAFLKKWWVESDFKGPNLPLSLRFKVSGCQHNSIISKLFQLENIKTTRFIIWKIKSKTSLHSVRSL